MDADLRKQIVTKLGAAFGGARDVSPSGNQPLHVLLGSLELPSDWTPNPTRALTIWDDWSNSRPAFYVEPGVQGPDGRVPQNPTDSYILGETWRTFSFAFLWNGDDPVLAVQRWLTLFDKERPR